MSQKGSALLFLTILIVILLSTAAGLYYFTKKQNPQPQIIYASPTSVASKTKWQTYNASHFVDKYGPSYKFSIQYPQTWKVEELDINNNPQIWLSPIHNELEHKQIHIYFKQHSTLEQWINENSTSRTSMDRSEVNIKALGKIESVEYTGSVGVGILYGTAFQLKDTVYDFFIVTDGANAIMYKDLIDGIISTFKL